MDGGDGGPCVETNTTGCFLVEGAEGGPEVTDKKLRTYALGVGSTSCQ